MAAAAPWLSRLALNLDLPSDLDGAVDVALHGDRRHLDVGALDGGADRFVIMSGLGFDAAMLRDANPTLKARIGALAYVLSGLRQLRRRPARFRIRLDDQPPITRVGQGLLIANLGRLQGGITMVPDARPDDGVLDVAVLGTRTPVDWLRLATQVLLRRQLQPEQQRQAGRPLELFRARRVKVDCDRPQPVERDGDPAGSTRRLVVDVLPGRSPCACPPCGGIRAGAQPMNTEQTAALLREAERRGLPATNCSRWLSTTGPTPGYASPAGRATLAGRLRPLGLDPPATPPGRRPVEQDRQP